jgi:hypothetical protein
VSTLGQNKHSKLKSVRKNVLPADRKQQLSNRSISLTQKGDPITIRILRMFSRTLKKQYFKSICEGKGVASGSWVQGLLCRNLMIVSCKQQNRNTGRVQNMHRFIVSDYFSKVRTTVEELGDINKRKRARLSLRWRRIVTSERTSFTDPNWWKTR